MQPAAAVAFVLSCALVVILAVLYLRYRYYQNLHEERLAALEKGTDVPMGGAPAPWSPRVYLLRGLIWSFSGAALVVCLLGLAWSSQRSETAETMAWRAKTLSETMNVPIEQARQIVDKDEVNHLRGAPLSIALLGLIPLGVGLAYLVFFYSDPSRQGRVGMPS